MTVTLELPDLFPGFETATFPSNGLDLHCRIGGSGPPLLLLHGFPQCNAMWHKVAPALSEHFTLILPDLPGYGQSGIPALSASHQAYSKRSMAEHMLILMKQLGYTQFLLAGHDRGARVAYRLALDHPDAVQKVAILDILPTYDYWQLMDRAFALQVYHWAFLAQPAPFPENLIAASSKAFLNHTLASWTAAKTLDCFTPEALAHYHAFFNQPDRIAATCEDYRAGATLDVAHDAADLEAGRRIACPLLTLWGETGIVQSGREPATQSWSRWAVSVSGGAVLSGHFLAEENPSALLDQLLPFLRH